MLTVGLYISLFIICSIMLRYVGISYMRTMCQCAMKQIYMSKYLALKYLMLGMVCLSPLIVLYGVRYGIGTDYHAYADIYYQLHTIDILEYIRKHLSGECYLEIGYYILNKIACNYVVLQIITAGLIYCVVVVSFIRSRIPWGMAILIFLCEHFAYSMNGVRFTIALVFILLGYTYLVNNKIFMYIIFVLCASCFHTSMLIAIIFIMLCELHSAWLNKLRDLLLLVCIVCFPLILPTLFYYAKNIPFFERYFAIGLYAFHVPTMISFKWLLHIIPIILPLLIVCKMKLIDKNAIVMRIFILEIPFRMIGLYNELYSRFARIPQLIEIIMIPMILLKIKDRRLRCIMSMYYFCWYIFYFIYQTYYIGNNEIIPYETIFIGG